MNMRRYSEIAEIMANPKHTPKKREQLIKAINETYDFLEEGYKRGKI